LYDPKFESKQKTNTKNKHLYNYILTKNNTNTRVAQRNKDLFSLPSHPLIMFQINKYNLTDDLEIKFKDT